MAPDSRSCWRRGERTLTMWPFTRARCRPCKSPQRCRPLSSSSVVIRASGKSFRHAKAIVNFADPSILLDFVQNLASSPWVDERGAEHQLLVEFAAYQAIPSPTTVSDPLCGTLEEDDHYQKFLQDLQTTEQQPNSVSLEEQLEGLLLREKELFRTAMLLPPSLIYLA